MMVEPPQRPGSAMRGLRSFRARVLRRRSVRWALRGLLLWGAIALLADMLANDKPLYCRVEGADHFPVFRSWLVDQGWAGWPEGLAGADWYSLSYQRVVWPPIPYAARTLDSRNMNYRSPSGPQAYSSLQFRHWLGTALIGRDLAAGLIHGSRTALLVGLVAMGIAGLIGLSLGLFAGYFGDRRWRPTRAWLLLQLAAWVLSIWWISGPGLAPWFPDRAGGLAWEKILFPLLVLPLAHLLARRLVRRGVGSRGVPFPADLLLMRTIEILNAIPNLFLLLGILAIFSAPSILQVMAVIGLLSWTGVARFARAETFRIREEAYIEAVELLGYSRRRILFRHILPNALPPVLVLMAFGFSGAILLEAYLSFLGLGLAAEEVTWGSLLQLARNKPDAWWLALFPGLALFTVVGLLNTIGEGLAQGWGLRRG